MVCTAYFDPLRDEGESYADALEKAGIATKRHRGPGLIHGFFGMGDASPAARAEAEKARADFRRCWRAAPDFQEPRRPSTSQVARKAASRTARPASPSASGATPTLRTTCRSSAAHADQSSAAGQRSRSDRGDTRRGYGRTYPRPNWRQCDAPCRRSLRRSVSAARRSRSRPGIRADCPAPGDEHRQVAFGQAMRAEFARLERSARKSGSTGASVAWPTALDGATIRSPVRSIPSASGARCGCPCHARWRCNVSSSRSGSFINQCARRRRISRYGPPPS